MRHIIEWCDHCGAETSNLLVACLRQATTTAWTLHLCPDCNAALCSRDFHYLTVAQGQCEGTTTIAREVVR